MTDNLTCHPSFEIIDQQAIDALQIQATAYRHLKTGAVHYHLAADNPENVFLVALRTVPTDSTGVAHILEHTALCGSEKYPVRDPFFMMIRRSLNTFMNAFTSSDWTAYPFASLNKKDFNNLLDVYLDAVFFSRLDPLDFAQEGHRLEFTDVDNPESELVYKGVVFNEMKGAMSSVASTLWQTLSKHLFPYNTYHFNSGGDPEHITDLSYEQLVAFYRTHYHPSNAVFMTFGDIPAIEHQTKFEQQALTRFEQLDEVIEVANEKRYFAPLKVEEAYSFSDPAADFGDKSHIVLGWLWGQNSSLEQTLSAHLVSGVLLENSASPLMQLLETTELGNAPSPLIGLEDSNKEMVFVCGIEGSNPDQADDFEQAVLTLLEQLAEDGIPHEQLEAVLHQLELQQREIGGDHYPYGLQLILSALPAATHRNDPLSYLNLDAVLAELRQKIQDPDYIKQQIRQLLLDNRHRVRLVMRPDSELANRKEQAEKQQLANIKASLSEQQKQAIVEQSQALLQRQQQVDDIEILPKVTLADVPAQLHIPSGRQISQSPTPTFYYDQGTNGLVYQQIVVDLPELDEEEQALLPYLSQCLTEVGIADKTYLQAQQWQAQVCGSISAFANTRGAIDDEQRVTGFFVLSAKSLHNKQTDVCLLLQETFAQPRFDEHSRIREIVSQIRARREQSVTGNGHGLAMAAASSGLSPAAALSHRLSGLEGIRQIKALDQQLDNDDALAQFAQRLSKLHQRISQMPRRALVVAEAEREPSLNPPLQQALHQLPSPAAGTAFSLPATRKQVKQLWRTNTQVNFCAKAYATVTMEHPDAAALTVLGGFLRNGFLHRAIREQGGAYGGGASQDSTIAAFRFFSYRDPRLQETLDDFDQAVTWLQQTEHEPRALEEAILGVISSLDKPSSPAGEAKQAFHNELFGRTPAVREAFRQRVLAVQLDDLKQVAARYLQPEKASTAVITHQQGQEKLTAADDHGYQLFEL